MITKKVYMDTKGRLHDKNGRFHSKPQDISLSESEILSFYQKEGKPQTYVRTGVHLEIERDPDDVFAYMVAGTIVVSVIWNIIRVLT
jgi:hypothetical protein